MSIKKAGILKIGSFDIMGRPIGWEFDRKARLNEKDGIWTIGGYSSEDLHEIVNKHAEEKSDSEAENDDDASLEVENDEAEAEVKEKPILQSPPPTIFRFRALIVGVAAKKPAKMQVHKELKLLSIDVDELAPIDKLLEADVEVMIIKRATGMTQDEFFEKFKEKFNSDNASKEPDALKEVEIDVAEVETEEPTEGELALDASDALDVSDDEDVVESEADESEQGEQGEQLEQAKQSESTEESKSVCEKCGAELIENLDDPTQLICSNAGCSEVYTNPDAEALEFE